MDSLMIMKEPYEAAVNKDWDAMIKWYDENRIHLQSPLNFSKDTAFHMAIYSGRKKPFKDLLKIAEEEPFAEHAATIKNAYGNTPLHEAAISGNIEVVKLLVRKGYKDLLRVRNDLRGETPLYSAASCGRKHIVEYLASEVPDQMTPDNKLADVHRYRKTKRSDADNALDVDASILHDAIRGKHFGTALLLLKLDGSLALQLERKSGKTSLELLASTPLGDDGDQDDDYGGIDDDENIKQVDNQVRSTDLESSQSKKRNRKFTCFNICKVAETIYLLIWRAFSREWPAMRKLQKAKRKHEIARRLSQMLIEEYTLWLPNVTEDLTSFLRATEGPNQEHVSQSMQQNMLHVAIMYRRKEIFDQLKKTKLLMTRLARGIDQNGYTILHHAAHLDGYSGGTRPGPVYQLQDELKWFKRVEKIMPSHYARLRDKVKNRTAQELFKESHKDQHKIAQKWTKKTSQSCSVVAVLVAFAVFAAAHTVAGGSSRPILLNSNLILIFTIMASISLWNSLTSVVTFLSILTSPFEFKDFHKSLPLKLTVGFSLLYLSVSTTMVALATVFLIDKDSGGWSKTFFYSAAFLPISIFALMSFVCCIYRSLI